MANKQRNKAKTASKWMHSTRLHLILYGSLLVATPFVMLQSFTVDAVGKASRSTFILGNAELPILGVTIAVLSVLALALTWRRLTVYRIAAGITALLMIALSQQITDYYFGHKFYDLQQNWHYGAYAIFAFMVHRDLSPRGTPMFKIILTTYLVALSLSTFDEIFQMYLSSRVFDTSDIAKDAWGCLIGIVLVHLGGRNSDAFLIRWKNTLSLRLRDSIRHPLSLFIHLFVLSLLMLCVSSLLSDSRHWLSVVLLSFGIYLLYLIFYVMSRIRWAKFTLLGALLLVLIGQTYSFVKYRHDNIVYNRYGLTIYKGIPVPFFDMMIYPDGTFRLVDKKHYFNLRDQNFFLKFETDIILIGSGESGLGGEGFPEKTVCQFIFNQYSMKGTQLIILKTQEACDVFNRLKREGKNVLFIHHNTC